MLTPKDRLAFALDLPDLSSALPLAGTLAGHVGVLKIGLELFMRSGPDAIRRIRETTGLALFLDLKLHDIPETVARAVANARELGVTYLTVHTAGGRTMMARAREAAGEDLKLLGVTVLTSTGGGELAETGVAESLSDAPGDLVAMRATLAREAGLSGVVCSGLEAALVKAACGPDFLAVTPGIRPEWTITGEDDQKRIMTPGAAIAAGADLLVVGRPIRNAQDPALAADKVVEEIARAAV